MARSAKKTGNKPGNKSRVGDILLRVAPIRPACDRAAIVLEDALDPDTPVFSADPHDPDLVIREIGGHAVRGYFKQGKFIEVL